MVSGSSSDVATELLLTAVELFESRIHQGNFKEFIAERKDDGLPPGVNVMREFGIVVRKPSN